MSLLTELESRGVTAEDLEKAASVRLFEKAAAAEGVDLDHLDVNQVEDLYAAFLSDQSDDDYTKEASAMNDEIVDLFEKTAADEGIDLDDMADHELAELYNHYVDNVLPEQLEDAMLDDDDDDDYDYDYDKEASYDEDEVIFDMFQKTAAAEGLDLNEFSQYELTDMYDHYVDNVLPFQVGDKVAMAEVDEAQEKLAEAEILGRHMARAYMDEMEKDATSKATKAKLRAMGMAGPEGGTLRPTKNKKGEEIRNFSKKQREAASAMGKQRRGADGVRRVGKGRNSTLVQPHTREFKGQSANLRTTKAKLNALKRFGGAHKGKLIAGGVGLGAAGVGYAMGRHQKAASADYDDYISDAASDLAAEWLYENGY
jgi:hypothetical protein